MKQFKFIAHLIAICDVHATSKVFSKRAQSDEALIIDTPSFWSDCQSNLRKLQFVLGPEAMKHVESLKEGKLRMIGKDGKDANLTREKVVSEPDTDEAESMNLANLMSILNGDVTELVAVEPMDVIRPGNSPESVEQSLLNVQKGIVTKLLASFEARVKVAPVALWLRDMFDYRLMPFSNYDKLLTWGDDSISKIVAEKFPELDVFELQNESLSVKLWLLEERDTYTHARDPRNLRKGTELKITGEGSVMEALFSQPEITGRSICNYLHVADYMVAYAWQSCCGERVGSHINIVKSLKRTLLSDSMFDDHTFNKCNLPELHEIDYDALVKIWKEGAKKRVGIFKGREAAATKEQSLSKVVKRHLARTSSIPIFKKRDEKISIYEAK